jgi:hypothetical protein
MQQRKTNNVLSFEMREKMNLLISQRLPLTMIADRFNVSLKTVQRAKKLTLENVEVSHGLQGSRKKRSNIKYKEVEDYALDLIERTRSSGYSLKGPHLQIMCRKKARSILADPSASDSAKTRYTGATFGRSWLTLFYKRNDIRSIRINGERASVPINYDELMDPIRELIQEKAIPPSRIFNMDETGLFYRSFPKSTLAQGFDDGAGAKEDKSRITLLLSVNGDGSERSVWVIGKSKTPRGFSEDFLRENNVKYFYNKTAWMTKTIFAKILKEFDEGLSEPAVLLLDNFSGHKLEEMNDFRHLIPIFLPPNTTAKTQPLDAGIISVFKLQYRNHLVEFAMDKIMADGFRTNMINLKMALPWVTHSFSSISPGTIGNCFRKALGLNMFEIAPNINEVANLLKNLKCSVEAAFGIELSSEELLEYGLLDTISEAEESADSDESDEEEICIPSPGKFLKILDTCEDYLRNTRSLDYVKYVRKIRKQVKRHMHFK